MQATGNLPYMGKHDLGGGGRRVIKQHSHRREGRGNEREGESGKRGEGERSERERGWGGNAERD